MLYIEDISALQFWLSPARVVLDGRHLQRLSCLSGCPRTARASCWHSLEGLPFGFEHPTLAVPAPEFRVQRKRFDYHVWTRPVPEGAFVCISDDVAVASPALAIAQASQKLKEEHLAQIICSMAGSYLMPPGKHSGIIDKLEPIVTIEELWVMANQLGGICKTERLRAALKYVAEGSASPGETNLLLTCAMTKAKGGLFTRGWKMNAAMEVPHKLRRYLGQSLITPDLQSPERDLILEYDSDEWHSSAGQIAKDEKRRIVFELMGYKVIPVRTANMSSAKAFEGIAVEVLKAFGKKRVASTSQQLAAREILLRSLSRNPLLS